jgi:hypothetical protein
MSGFMPLASVDLIVLVNSLKELSSGPKDYIFFPALKKTSFQVLLNLKN